MDREHFDTLARLFAVKQSRRATLTALVIAVLLGHDPDAAIAERRGQKRKRDGGNRVQQSSAGGTKGKSACKGNKATGGACQLADGKTGTCCNGVCVQCCGTDASTCPNPGLCHTRACVNNTCTPQSVANGTDPNNECVGDTICCNGSCAGCCGNNASTCPNPPCQRCSAAGTCENLYTTARDQIVTCTNFNDWCCQDVCCPHSQEFQLEDQRYHCECRYRHEGSNDQGYPTFGEVTGCFALAENDLYCTTDADCVLAGHTCQTNRHNIYDEKMCLPKPCATDADCPAGSTCDSFGGVCLARCPDAYQL